MLQAIAGHDPADASTSAITPPDYTRDLEGGVRGMRLGLPRRYYLDWEGLHADVRSAAVAAFAELERQGARIEEIDIPLLDLLPSIWVPLVAEAFDYHRETLRQRPNEYGDFLRTKLYMAGTFTAQDYLRAQRLRTRLAREVAAVLERVDALVFPGQAVPALSFDEIPQNVIMPQSSRYTAPWNLTGQPAISVPPASVATACRSRSRWWAGRSTRSPCCASRAPTSAPRPGTPAGPIPRAGLHPERLFHRWADGGSVSIPRARSAAGGLRHVLGAAARIRLEARRSRLGAPPSSPGRALSRAGFSRGLPPSRTGRHPVTSPGPIAQALRLQRLILRRRHSTWRIRR